MVHIDRCPKCGKPGSLHKKFFRCGKPNCKCASGELHGPKPVVKHYDGIRAGKKHWKFCYIRLKDLAEEEKERITRLLEKYE